LVNSGFYNTTLFNKNLWASENFLRYNDAPLTLASLFNLYYPSFSLIQPSYLNTRLLTKNNSQNFELLNFYENSFFWFTKRFYFFNDVISNHVANKKSPSTFFYVEAPLVSKHDTQLFLYLLASSLFSKLPNYGLGLS